MDNLGMGFHCIKKIPPLTFRVAPFFRLLLVFYLFGTAAVLMFMLFGLQTLALVTGALWGIFILVSIVLIVLPFFRQSVDREWRGLLEG
jgi:polyferredoxin